jgi:uncharacterized protein
MVIEGIITTENEDGSMHVAPIGPHVDPDLHSWTLKPFKTSKTFERLHHSGRGVFHVVDDGLLMIQAVLGQAHSAFPSLDARHHPECGWVLVDAVRAIPLSVQLWDTSTERAVAECSAGPWIEVRSYWGWNRARNSLLELAILLSRRHMMSRDSLDQAIAHHRVIIEKTAGPRELQGLALAMDCLRDSDD